MKNFFINEKAINNKNNISKMNTDLFSLKISYFLKKI